MSDVSVLSQEYKTASELSHTISQALIVLKKVHYALPGADTISSEERLQSQQRLVEIVAALIPLLDAPPAKPLDVEATVQIPGAFVVHVQDKRRGNLPDFIEDLTALVARLRAGPAALIEEDFALLDELASIADAEATRVFRRLMRR